VSTTRPLVVRLLEHLRDRPRTRDNRLYATNWGSADELAHARDRALIRAHHAERERDALLVDAAETYGNEIAQRPTAAPHLVAGDVVRVRMFTGLTGGWHTGHIVQADDGDLIVEMPGPRLTTRTGSFATDSGPRTFTDQEPT
jgi:hypothetical protein